MQVIPHIGGDPEHVDIPFVGIEHGEQLVPQFITDVLDTHIPLHRCEPVLQLSPQLVPSHVADPPAIDGHALHDVGPQFIIDVLSTHIVPHR
jgi:hypothetical protein